MIKDILEGAGMAVLLLVALSAVYFLAVFLIAGADIEEFRRILESLWRSGALS